jgi:hypothetical protein
MQVLVATNTCAEYVNYQLQSCVFMKHYITDVTILSREYTHAAYYITWWYKIIQLTLFC